MKALSHEENRTKRVLGAPEPTRNVPVQNESVYYDRPAYLAILTPETRKRLLSLRSRQ